MILTIAVATARAVLGRRRTILLVLLAAVPALVALLARGSGVSATETTALTIDLLVVRAVLPIVALVLGTAALGSELEDGTAVYVLASPVARWQIVVAKLLVAIVGTFILAGVSTLVTGLVLATDGPSLGLVWASVLGVLVGSVVYCALFVALSLVTTRAFIVGLIYVLVWEGALASLFGGTRFLSVRQYVVGVANGIGQPPGAPFGDTLPIESALMLAAVVLVLAAALAVERLRAWEVRPAD
ncbi:MAG TPA: ABC transporter permease subunit [Candidatus Limnocylindrales bacterium]|nr:ABC transporter permease subunit [Candidatus Limnocylindrales bacterium]